MQYEAARLRFTHNIDLRNETTTSSTQRKPLALDLYCGEGGAAAGLYMAGFDVVGVDIEPRKKYPFLFVQADALNPPFDLSMFDFIWASPPCQAHSVCNNFLKRDYPQLVPQTRNLLKSSGVPYVMENVPGAPFIDPVALTGSMFGLNIIRRRHFECSMGVSVPLHRPDRDSVAATGRVTVAGSCGGGKGSISEWKAGMDIDWMRRETLTQAVPPAYAWYLSKQFLPKKALAALPGLLV
ncbi:MAG: hypothetical protein R8K20_11700 [Gallionellaceae bacterium]